MALGQLHKYKNAGNKTYAITDHEQLQKQGKSARKVNLSYLQLREASYTLDLGKLNRNKKKKKQKIEKKMFL